MTNDRNDLGNVDNGQQGTRWKGQGGQVRFEIPRSGMSTEEARLAVVEDKAWSRRGNG